MAEATVELLPGAEVAEDSGLVVTTETVAPDEILNSVEVRTEPEIAWNQRAIGCGAILCAGCPLVMICPSARAVEVEATESTSPYDELDETNQPFSFDELATNLDSNSSGQASLRVSDGAPAPVETRAADRPSPSESSLAEVNMKHYDKKVTIEKSSVEKAEPVSPSQLESTLQAAEQQPERTYLDELLDDSIDVVVAQSLRQPVIKDEIIETTEPKLEPVMQAEPGEPLATEPIVAELFVAPVDSEEVIELVDLASSMLDEPEANLEIVDVIEPPLVDDEIVETVATDEYFVATSETAEEPIAEAAELVDVVPLLDVDPPLLADEPYDDFEIDLPQLNIESLIDELEPEAAVLEETLLEIDTILTKIADGHKTTVNDIKRDVIDEFHFDWRTFADDLDEEHRPLDENSDNAALAQKIKKVIAKLLGRRAVYAISSSGISD